MARRIGAERLPTTSYAVLGLLTFREMSGYDLKQFADMSIKYFFWSPVRSQIYAELRRLASLGYVTEREVEQERRPDKRLYKITLEGEQKLQEWLERPEVEPDILKSTFLLRLFFGSRTPMETLVAQLQERQRQAWETLEQYRGIEQHIKDDQQYFFPYMTLRAGLANIQGCLSWLEQALQQLKEQQTAAPPSQ